MISDILNLYEFIDKKLDKASVLRAYFSWDGIKKYGSDEISIRLSANPNKEKIWFYQITPYKNFVFVPYPVNPGINIDFGKQTDDKNPDSSFFRYVASPLAKFASGGEENIKVDFIVLGYIPNDLIDKFVGKTS